MAYFESAEAVDGKVIVYDERSMATVVEPHYIQALLLVCAKALVQRSSDPEVGGCKCGSARRVYVRPSDGTFSERVGCSNCDQWDSPRKLLRP